MIQNADDIEEVAIARDPTSRQAFLSSHRALAVCTREFARLSKELIAAAKIVGRNNLDETPTTRQAPDRCIVQLGPVALTVAWLRNGSDSPDAGPLMAIVWRGVIAPRGEHSPERLGARRVPATPVAEWEETFVVSADSEATWIWHPGTTQAPGLASPELAAQFIERLRMAHESFTNEALAQDALPTDSTRDPSILI